MNLPISPSFTFENFQNKSLYRGSNLNEGIVKETSDFFSISCRFAFVRKNNNSIQDTEDNFCLKKHPGRAQSWTDN